MAANVAILTDADRDSLFNDCAELARRIAASRKYRGRGLAPDELAQIALIAAWEASRAFDGSRCVPFPGFAGVCCHRAILTELRAASRARSTPIDSPDLVVEDGETARREESVDEAWDLVESIELTKLEGQILGCRFGLDDFPELSWPATAKALGITVSEARAAYAGVVQRLRVAEENAQATGRCVRGERIR